MAAGARMHEQTIFKTLAKYYDLFYGWKDYEKEAATIRELIRAHKTSPGNDLLEVACGTGKHAQQLKTDFKIVGTDLNDAMLRIARRRCPDITFRRADMVSLDLGRQFDVVLCLFSSIGYVKTRARLKKTLFNFARHLNPGGVLIVEPWWTRANFKPGTVTMNTAGDDTVKMVRQAVSKVRGNVSIMDMHYLIAEKDKGVIHHVDRHELGLFEREDTLAYLHEAGLQAKFLEEGLMRDRGLYVAVKP
jgi:ubiquinone/menaquinone biosynthesis C-methylase UbiE